MTIHWKAVEQYFTVVLFVILVLHLALSRVKEINLNIRFSSFYHQNYDYYETTLNKNDIYVNPGETHLGRVIKFILVLQY